MTAQPTPAPRSEEPESEDQRLALRRIAQQLKRLRAELDNLNQGRDEGPGRRDR
jgi:hypothetical protein